MTRSTRAVTLIAGWATCIWALGAPAHAVLADVSDGKDGWLCAAAGGPLPTPCPSGGPSAAPRGADVSDAKDGWLCAAPGGPLPTPCPSDSPRSARVAD